MNTNEMSRIEIIEKLKDGVLSQPIRCSTLPKRRGCNMQKGMMTILFVLMVAMIVFIGANLVSLKITYLPIGENEMATALVSGEFLKGLYLFLMIVGLGIYVSDKLKTTIFPLLSANKSVMSMQDVLPEGNLHQDFSRNAQTIAATKATSKRLNSKIQAGHDNSDSQCMCVS